QRLARWHAGADAPPEAAGGLHLAWLLPGDEAGIAGPLDALVDLLAEDRVEGEVGLAGAGAAVFVADRQFDHRAQRERERALLPLRHQVPLETDPEVAEVV